METYDEVPNTKHKITRDVSQTLETVHDGLRSMAAPLSTLPVPNRLEVQLNAAESIFLRNLPPELRQLVYEKYYEDFVFSNLKLRIHVAYTRFAMYARNGEVPRLTLSQALSLPLTSRQM